jgi:hypothetical protein
MFIPPNNLKKQFESSAKEDAYILLKASHLIIPHSIAQKAFGSSKNVYMVYYPQKNALMLAPTSDELFKSMHKAKQQMLKDKNLNGDKSVALHEILIDNQVNQEDKRLDYEFEASLGILNIKL